MIISTTPDKTLTGTVATITELKSQLNIPVEFTDDDTLLTDLLSVAVENVVDDINSDILDTTNVLTQDLTTQNYSVDAVAVPSIIYINAAPVRSISKIEISTDGTNYTEIAATKYRVNIIFTRAEIRFFENNTATHIRFTFSTGYTDAKRPKKLKQAVILKAADLFDTERSAFIVGPSVFNAHTYARLIYKHIRNYW